MRLSTVKQGLFGLLVRHAAACDVEDTIIVAGLGRSGTTWVGEILRDLPGYRMIHEPLDPGRRPEASRIGYRFPVYDRVLAAPGDERPVLFDAMHDILRGRVGPSTAWNFKAETILGRLLETVTHRKLTVKFTRAMRMLHWIAERFDVRGMVVVIRHPCAVVSSMLKFGAWNPPLQPEDAEHPGRWNLLETLPPSLGEQFRTDILNSHEPYEMMAHLWAIDYHTAFFGQTSGEFPWVLTPYERIVSRGQPEIRRVLRALGKEDQWREVRDRLGRPASYSSEDLRISSTSRQLSKWKEHLTSDQIERILEIAHRYDLDFYDHDPEPNYDALMEFQRQDVP